MQVPSGWPRIFFVIYWRRKSVAKRRVCEERGTAKEGRTVRSKWEKREQQWGWESKVGRSTGKRQREEGGRGGRGDRKSFTGGPASSLRSLQKGTIMRIHWGKDSRPFRECILLKCRRVRIHEKGTMRRLAGNEKTRILYVSIFRKLEYFKDAERRLLNKRIPN